MELQIGIVESEHLAKEKMVASAEAACLTKEHACAAQRLTKIQPPLQEPKEKQPMRNR